MCSEIGIAWLTYREKLWCFFFWASVIELWSIIEALLMFSAIVRSNTHFNVFSIVG